MHMADALISPAVGGTMWAATAGLTVYSARKLKEDLDEHLVPLMGVLGAFIFAAQMLNFTIPATGSSGHLGGGMILAILLGPYAAFLVMASVLTIQALFFADGGLLALGCNIFNLGFFPCFIAYPFIYKKIVGAQPTQGRILLGAMAAAILSLQMGAFGVVLETLFSGISELTLFNLRALDAAHTPGDRHRGGSGHRGGGELCLEGAPAHPDHGGLLPSDAGAFPQAAVDRAGAVCRWWPEGCYPGSPPPTRTAWNGPLRAFPARKNWKPPRPGCTGPWPGFRNNWLSCRTMTSRNRQKRKRESRKRERPEKVQRKKAGPPSAPGNPWPALLGPR